MKYRNKTHDYSDGAPQEIGCLELKRHIFIAVDGAGCGLQFPYVLQ